jgi:hypothetical protein
MEDKYFKLESGILQNLYLALKGEGSKINCVPYCSWQK